MRLLSISIMTLLFVLAGSSEAANLRVELAAEQSQQSCKPISKGAAMSAVARRIEGKVLSASLNMNSRPPVYRVKVISKNGRVRHVMVNACNGRLLG